MLGAIGGWQFKVEAEALQSISIALCFRRTTLKHQLMGMTFLTVWGELAPVAEGKTLGQEMGDKLAP